MFFFANLGQTPCRVQEAAIRWTLITTHYVERELITAGVLIA